MKRARSNVLYSGRSVVLPIVKIGHKGTFQPMSEPLPVVFWEIGSPNPSRAIAFYRAVCNWPFEDADELGYSPANSGKEGIPGGILDTNGDRPFAMIYVRVPDLEAAISAALSQGGSLIKTPTKVPDLDSMFAVVADPDGNRLGFYWDPVGRDSTAAV